MSTSITARDTNPIDLDKLLNALLPYAALILSAVISLASAYTYFDKKNIDHANSQFEARKPFVTQQSTLYLETTVLVGELVSRPRSEVAWQNNERRFGVLLWGELPAYESDSVRDAMAIVSKKIDTYRNAKTEPAITMSKMELQDAATDLSTKMGKDLNEVMTLK